MLQVAGCKLQGNTPEPCDLRPPVFRIGSPGIIFVDYLDKLGLKAIRF